MSGSLQHMSDTVAHIHTQEVKKEDLHESPGNLSYTVSTQQARAL